MHRSRRSYETEIQSLEYFHHIKIFLCILHDISGQSRAYGECVLIHGDVDGGGIVIEQTHRYDQLLRVLSKCIYHDSTPLLDSHVYGGLPLPIFGLNVDRPPLRL